MSAFHGEFTSTDASGLSEPNSRFSLFNEYGAAITVQSDDRVVITDIAVSIGADITVTIYEGANNSVAAGEVIYKAVQTTVGLVVAFPLNNPHYCTVSNYPKVLTSGSGQVYAQIRGYIVKAIG